MGEVVTHTERAGPPGWDIRPMPGMRMVEAVRRPTPTSIHVLVAPTLSLVLAKIAVAG